VLQANGRRVLSGIIFFNLNGLRWRDAPGEYGPHKTLYNRWKRWNRWSDLGAFARIMMGLTAEAPDNGTISIPSRDINA
jgi:transposase